MHRLETCATSLVLVYEGQRLRVSALLFSWLVKTPVKNLCRPGWLADWGAIILTLALLLAC